jgi:hypothetical protein
MMLIRIEIVRLYRNRVKSNAVLLQKPKMVAKLSSVIFSCYLIVLFGLLRCASLKSEDFRF